MAFADAGDGWAVGAGGVILHTTDGGGTWVSQSSGVLTGLSGVAFADASHGWAVGASGVILATTDGGATWTKQTSPFVADLGAVACTSADDGCAVGAGGVILATTDGGATWTKQTSPVTADLTAVAFRQRRRRLGRRGRRPHRGHHRRRRDVGAASSHTSADLASVAFANTGDGWAVGAGGAIVATTDGGTTGRPQPSGTGADLAGTVFFSDKHGLAVGVGGVVVETLSAGVPDTTAPVTTATGLQPDVHTGWRNTAQPVTLTASDAGSGVAATYYVIDGKQKTYAGPFQVFASRRLAHVLILVGRCGRQRRDRAHGFRQHRHRPARLSGARRRAGQAGQSGQVPVSRERSLAELRQGRRDDQDLPRPRGRQDHHAQGSDAEAAPRLLVPGQARAWRLHVGREGHRHRRQRRGSKTGRRSLRVVNWVIHSTADVQRYLIALDYLPSGAVTGVDDYRTQQALMAFQAWNGLTRDGVAGRATRAKLELASPPKPRAESASGHYAEIFRSLGVLLCVSNGRLVRVVHCSTGRPSLQTRQATSASS